MPVSIIEEHVFLVPPAQFFEFITNPQNMTTFVGFGPVPAINKVGPLTMKDHGTSARYHVENSDGSSHEEEVTVSDPPHRFCLRIGSFSAPYKYFINHIEEKWDCEQNEYGTKARRTFTFFPSSVILTPLIYVAAHLFWHRAVKRNHEMINDRLLLAVTDERV